MNTLARTYIILLTFFVALAVVGQQPASPPRWEPTENVPAESLPVEPGANVSVHDRYIYIELEQPQNVTLFTILGQPVTQMQLPAGTSRLKVNDRGIYILKIGSTTRRITI